MSTPGSTSGTRTSPHQLESALSRLDDTHVRIANPQGIPVTLLAHKDVPIETAGTDQLLQFLSVQDTLNAVRSAQNAGRITPFLGDQELGIRQVILTPDFHRGAGIPVGTVADIKGFVVPAAIGILERPHLRLKEEAPYAYKPITPVVQTIEDAGVARKVARLWPLLTVKG